MPVNSFDNYPMSWKPDKNKLGKPLFKSIAEYLEQDIKNGVLRENDKLPPQRELADYLDINLSTITRAFKICEMKGLIYAVVGKGSFVSANAGLSSSIMDNNHTTMIEMGIISPFVEHNNLISSIAIDILSRANSDSYFDYENPLGSVSQRRAAKKWLNKYKVDTKEENIIIAAGTQNALAIALVALFQSGNRIATDTYTYANFISLANMLNIQLVPVEGDEMGMLPGRLDSICKNSQVQGIYLMPSCSNPSNSVMDDNRRKEIASIIKKYNLIIIEDDTYAFLHKKRFTPLFNILPKQTVHIMGVSKPICAGVRVAFMCFPDGFKFSLEQGLFNLNLKTSSLNVEIVTEILNKNLDEDLINKKRNLAIKRNALFAEQFATYPCAYNKTSYYQWLLLPNDCSGKLFEKQAANNGVKIYGAERFTVGSLSNTCAVRIATCSPQNMNELEKGLHILKKLYDGFKDNEPNHQLIV